MKLGELITKLIEIQIQMGDDVPVHVADYDDPYSCELSYVQICDYNTNPDDGPVRSLGKVLVIHADY